MIEHKNETPEEFFISEATLSKSIKELEQEEAQLEEAVKSLTKALGDVKDNKSADFEAFAAVNGKLRGNQALLEEVKMAILIKKSEQEDNGLNAFDRALKGTGEYAEADKIQNKERRATGK